MIKTYRGKISKKLESNDIYVFGSNTQGRHGKGSALEAKIYHGAIYGQAEGRQGNSYAIITKDLTKKIHPSISSDSIIDSITKLYEYAIENNELNFYIVYTAEGINLNSYTSSDLASFFYKAGQIPENIIFEDKFAELIKSNMIQSLF